MNLTALEFPLLVFSVIANLAIVMVVLAYSEKSQGKNFFVLFVLSQAVWIVVNYLSFQVTEENWLQMARWTIVTAVPHPVLFYLFIYSFLKKHKCISLRHLVLLIFLSLSMIIVALSPFLFTGLDLRNGVLAPTPGPAMPVFGIFVLSFICLTFYHLLKRWRVAKGIERVQWRFIGIGLLLTFFLVLFFSFLNNVIFDRIESVQFSHIYTLPFVLFTSYAIIRHHLLNIRVIATELSVGILSLLFLLEFLTSQSPAEFILNGVVFVVLVIIGVMLVKSVIREIERRKEVERLAKQLESANMKLKKLDEAKTEFLSITSHQLRTPLSGIKGYMSMMKEGDFGKFTDEQSGVIDRVYKEVERLIRLVQVFLNVSRIESGRLKIDKIQDDLTELAATVTAELRPAAEEKGLKLLYERPAQAIKLKADFDKLKDVVVNLVDNAIKYTQEGKIWVVTTINNGKARLEVHDTGVGIDSEYADHLFEKFSRAKGIAQVDSTGSGLGLFIVKKIIEGHEGKIWAESKGKGKGSVFKVELNL